MAETLQSPQLDLVERQSSVAAAAFSDGNPVFDQLLMQLADLVADRVAARLVSPRPASADEWLDTRRAAEYLGIGRDSLRRLAAERAIPTEQAVSDASCSSAGLTSMRGAAPDRRLLSLWAVCAMADSTGIPRRVRVERGIYRRPNGVLEVGFKDETGRQRWRTVDGGILAARKVREDLAARRARGESVAPKPRLHFGEAADCWLTGPVVDLPETTQVKYRCMVKQHLRTRFEARRLDAVNADDLARLGRELRAEGMSEATIAVILGVVSAIYKFAARKLGWSGTIPTTLMLRSERPKISETKRRPVFMGEQLEQTIAAGHEPFRTLFTVTALTGARISELCALTWADVRIDDPDDAEIEFGWQVDRHGNRRPTKTDGSARTVPVPR